MAFWLTPGETSAGHPALNPTELSNVELTKRVQVVWRNLPQVVDYRVPFHVPETERHSLAQFEALTDYLPAEFDTFWVFEPQRGGTWPHSMMAPGNCRSRSFLQPATAVRRWGSGRWPLKRNPAPFLVTVVGDSPGSKL
jgi:hypothetical protein